MTEKQIVRAIDREWSRHKELAATEGKIHPFGRHVRELLGIGRKPWDR